MALFTLCSDLPEMPGWCLELGQHAREHEDEGHSLQMLEQKVKRSTVIDDKWGYHTSLACMAPDFLYIWQKQRNNPQTPSLSFLLSVSVFSSIRWFLPDGWLLQLMCWWSLWVLRLNPGLDIRLSHSLCDPESLLKSLYFSFFNCKMELIIIILIELLGEANEMIYVNGLTLTYP